MNVLLLEDNVLIAMDLAATLAEIGVTVQGPAHTVQQADTLLRDRIPDLALLDFVLSDETCEGLAERLDDLGVSLIFVTGQNPDLFPKRFREHRIVQKPVAPKLLRDMIVSESAYAGRGTAIPSRGFRRIS